MLPGILWTLQLKSDTINQCVNRFKLLFSYLLDLLFGTPDHRTGLSCQSGILLLPITSASKERASELIVYCYKDGENSFLSHAAVLTCWCISFESLYFSASRTSDSTCTPVTTTPGEALVHRERKTQQKLKSKTKRRKTITIYKRV